MKNLLLAMSVTIIFAPLALAGDNGKHSSAPVKVQGPVTIQGAVEVLDDFLHQPYVQSASSISSTAPTVYFDIPDGKRLVIETIAFQASGSSNESNRMFFEPLLGADRILVPLAVQSTVVDGTAAYLIATHPVKIRLDSVAGSTNEIRIRRGTGAAGSLNGTLFGYLVDL